MINVAYVAEGALGLGHAVLRAGSWWRRTFAVILSDDVIDAEVPALRQY